MKMSELESCFKYRYLTIRQLAVMFVLYEARDKPVKLRDLALALKISRGPATRSWDGLCNMKLLRRVRSEEDGRDVFGFLTDEGKKFVEEIK